MISSADLRRNAAAATSDASRITPAKMTVRKVAAAAAAAAAAAVAAAPAAAAATVAAAAPTPADTPAPAPSAGKRVITYRHDPYSYKPITESSANVSMQIFIEMYESAARNTKLADFASSRSASASASSAGASATTQPVVMSSAGFALPMPASKRRAVAAAAAAAAATGAAGLTPSPREGESASFPAKNTLDASVTEDGVSEASSENGQSHPAATLTVELDGRRGSSSTTCPLPDTVQSPEESGAMPEESVAAAHFAPLEPLRLPAVIRYASVNFRFGSAWFIAPFKTNVSDIVVVQYPANNSLHMGIVSAITTTKPATFYSAENPNPLTLTEDEVALLPRLVRHARTFDKETKLDLRTHDLRSLQSAQQLADDMNAPIQFLDAEWLLDLSAITFLVNVYGEDMELLDRLADELASIEGAEVVFTYPAVQPAAQPYA